MTWWCSASRVPWDWSPRAYPGVWLAMSALLGWYVLARRRLTPDERVPEAEPTGEAVARAARSEAAGAGNTDDPRRPLAFVAGWLVLWAASDWPLGTLGSGYLASAVLLFVGAGVVPMIPGGFLTFADHPLYGVYELAPRVGGFDATADQQLAGALMKLGSVPLVWPVIGVLFARWAREPGAPSSAPPVPHTARSE